VAEQKGQAVVLTDVLPNRIAIVVGAFVLLFVWEVFWPSIPRFQGKAKAKWHHVGRNILLGLINATFASVFLGILGVWVLNLAKAHGLGVLRLLSPYPVLHLAVTFFVLDFWMYLWHRWNHNWTFLWRFHRMHHTDGEMDVTTALRFHLIEVFFSNVLQIGVIVLLGSQLWELVAYSIAFSIVVQLHHSNIRFPEWIDLPLRLVIKELPLGKAEEKVEKRGPPLKAAFDEAGAPTKAGEGFFRSIGMEPQKKDALKGALVRGDYLYASVTLPAQKTADILSKALPDLILGIEFPKKMRWGSSKLTYARPLHWVVALHGKWVVPFNIGRIASGRQTFGHRQRAPKALSLASAEDYVATLRKAQVMVDPEERKATILEQLNGLEEKTKGQALALPKILPQVVHLTEWPELTVGSFNESFLRIPQEVLISEMVEHQKYFPLAATDGRLMNQFVITADNTPSEKIRKGNEKVLAARLADGEFLYHQDLKVPLENFNEKLRAITFHEGLGTLHEKVERLVQYVKILHTTLSIGNLAEAEMAALYSKADLTSGLVGEFPDLQGIIGHAYALVHGLPQPVAQAIDEHWMPRGEKGTLPATPAGILTSLADKIDNLLSCFALGLIPSSSSDPFALRRQVLALVRIAIHHKLSFSLSEVLGNCYLRFTEETKRASDAKVVPSILDFFNNRIRTVFQNFGFSKPQIESALSKGVDDIYDSYLKVEALHEAQKTDPAFPLLAEVYKRSKGILPEKGGTFEVGKIVEPAEKVLAAVFEEVEIETLRAIKERNYPKAYQLIARLQPPLHTFFDEVRVLCEDQGLRENRLALISRVFGLFDQLLDFSKLHFA